MAAMGTIALLIYAAAAFTLGWLFRGVEDEHGKAKEAEQHNGDDDH